MNILLWIIQSLLAVHTAVGALWKFSNTAEETMPSLAMIPHPVWFGMSVLEILCALLLVLPALVPKLSRLAPIGAGMIAAEMLLFCAVHIASGNIANVGPMIYWLVVAGVCALIAYARTRLQPQS